MDLQTFRATAHAPTDAEWAPVVDGLGADAPPRESCVMYDGGFMLHCSDGVWYPHAWWYAPRPTESRDVAEAALFAWWGEFHD